MYKENTLFIIGAGASKEFGLPVGTELSEIISKKSKFIFYRYNLDKGDYDILNLLKKQYPDNNELNERLRASNKISDGIFLSNSIDNYIDNHANVPHISEMGKFQIALAISKAERASRLFFDVNKGDAKLDLEKLSNTWIDSFVRILFEKVSLENIDNLGNHVSIICFNYDRCIEYYLIEAIRQAYIDVTYEQAHSIVKNINIIHPYGSLGELPPSFNNHTPSSVSFGWGDPWNISERIKTYTEQIKDTTIVDNIRGAVAKAKQIIFLGFGFHPQNMELLQIEKKLGLKQVFSSGVGISPQETKELELRIAKLYGGTGTNPIWRDSISIEHDKTCKELFDLHWRNFSSG